MDGISPPDNALRLMRIKVGTETFHVDSSREWSMNRSQAMGKLWPMIEKLDQGNSAADFLADVETYFTRESVKVLPQHAKTTIRLAAEVVGNKKVLEWIAAAKEDKEEHQWTIVTKKPKMPADISPGLLEDLKTLVQAAPPNIQDLLRSRVQVVKMVFELFEQHIRQLTTTSETNTATNQQLKEELSSTHKLLAQPPVLKKLRKVILYKKPENHDVEDESLPEKRRLERTPAQKPSKKLKNGRK